MDIQCFEDTLTQSTTVFIFYTEDGYKGGRIIKQDQDFLKVILIKDEFGNNIHQVVHLPITSIVKPHRFYTQAIYIPIKELTASGYIKAGCDIDISYGLGSGINSCQNKIDGKYPIYQPLTLHNKQHRNTLMMASFFILQVIQDYFHEKKFSLQLVEQARWLVNVVLLIDNYTPLNQLVFLEALSNFCWDYLNFDHGTFIRQPINYILDILRIDGIYEKGELSISYIPTNFEGINYE